MIRNDLLCIYDNNAATYPKVSGQPEVFVLLNKMGCHQQKFSF